MRRERSLRRRLQHQRAADGQRGRQLVRHEIEREIEGRNARDRATRHAPEQREPPLGARQLIRRQHFTAQHARLGRAQPKRRHRARHFGLGVANRLATLAADQPRELALFGFDRQRQSLEHQRALVRRAAGPTLEDSGSAVDRDAPGRSRRPSPLHRRHSRRRGFELPCVACVSRFLPPMYGPVVRVVMRRGAYRAPAHQPRRPTLARKFPHSGQSHCGYEFSKHASRQRPTCHVSIPSVRFAAKHAEKSDRFANVGSSLQADRSASIRVYRWKS